MPELSYAVGGEYVTFDVTCPRSVVTVTSSQLLLNTGRVTSAKKTQRNGGVDERGFQVLKSDNIVTLHVYMSLIVIQHGILKVTQKICAMVSLYDHIVQKS